MLAPLRSEHRGNLALVSCLVHLLQLVDSQFTKVISAFCSLSPTKQGEQPITYLVHLVVHLRVHQSDSSNSRKEKKLNARSCALWVAAWARGGLGRPHFFSACATQKFCSFFPAHTLSPRVHLMPVFAIPIP